MNEKKKHKILDHPILAMFIFMIVFNIVSGLLSLTLLLSSDESVKNIISAGIAAVTLIIMELIFTKVWFKGEFDTTLGLPNMKKGFMYIIPVLIAEIICVIIDRFMNPDVAMNNLVKCFAYAFIAGVAEEMLFRSYALANFMRICKSYKQMMTAVILTALVFGSVHIFNIFSGGNVDITIVQTVFAVFFGIITAAIYLRTGSISYCMILHFVYDFIGMIYLDMAESGAMQGALTIKAIADSAIISIVSAVVGLYIIRKSKYGEIREIWNKKWNIEGN